MADLEKDLAAAKEEILQLQKDKEGLLATNETLSTTVEDLEKQIENLKGGVVAESVKEPAKIPTQSFKVDSVEYLFTIPQFQYDGGLITAEQALENKKLLAELVKIGFGGIKRKGE